MAILVLVIIFINFGSLFEKDKNRKMNFMAYEISLKIRGQGNKNILSNSFDRSPDEIIVNGKKTESKDKKYTFTWDQNFVILKWNEAITSCKKMFQGCKDITEIDFSNFDSSSVNDMSYMFDSCESLISINFKNFITSRVTIMSCMFRNCKSLISLDLSGFNTNNNEYTNKMFQGCESLTNLDLSIFETSKVIHFTSMFDGCINLQYLNINNSKAKSGSKLDDIFKNIPLNIVYCIKDEKLKEKLNSSNCKIEDCSPNWQQNQKKMIDGSSCVNKCGVDEGSDYPYEYENKCIQNCQNGYHNENGINKCKCQKEECLKCSHISLKFEQCLSCNDGYYPKYNDTNNLNPFINCYKLNEEYYLDNNIYMPCFQNCKTCDKSGNESIHNCLECKSIYHYLLPIQQGYYNCYENCQYYHYFNKTDNRQYCTEDSKCPNDYSKLIGEKSECISNCNHDNEYKLELNGKCVKNCTTNFIEKENKCVLNCNKESPFGNVVEQKCVKNCGINDLLNKNCVLNYRDDYNLFLYNILEEIEKENFDIKNLENNRIIKIEENFGNFTISNFELFKERINLAECENLLKSSYNIGKDTSLYILLIEINDSNILENKKEIYELYYPSNENKLKHIDLSICKDILIDNFLLKCENYSIESILNEACLTCKDGYGPMPLNNTNDNSKTNYKKCSLPPEGYYFDKITQTIKSCYSTCKTCYKGASNFTHNCLECKDNLKYNSITPNLNLFNCLEECPLNYSFYMDENTNKIYCVKECNNIYDKFIEQEKKCVKKCEGEFKYEFKKKCYKNCPSDSFPSKDDEFFCEIKCKYKEFPYLKLDTQECISNCSIKDMINQICKKSYKDDNETKQEDISTQIIDNILNGNLDDILQDIVTNDKEIIIKEENEVHQISTLSSQGGNKNVSSINFGECESILRNKSNISSDEELIIYKIEHFIEGYNIPIIEYVLFSQDGKIKLNLAHCDNFTIEYNIPVAINEKDINKHDPNSSYYNNKCEQTTSQDGTDMTLYERKNEYNVNNMSLCESNCIYKGYNSSTSQVGCDCQIKSNLTYNDDINNQNDLLNKLETSKSSNNLGVTQCFTGSTEQIKSNSAFYLLLFIIALLIIIFIIFYCKGYESLETQIDNEIHYMFKDKKDDKKIVKQNNRTRTRPLEILNINHINNVNNINNITKKKKINLNKNMRNINSRSKRDISNINQSNKTFLKKNKNKKNNHLKNKKNYPNKSTKKPNKVQNNNQKKKRFNDYELNWLEYKEAIQYDKRTCGDYYCSLIKNKQLFIFTFFSFNDYNSGIIKKFIFFLSFALHYTANALFFNDETMHQIYEDHGEFNFTYQIPKIAISAVISTLVLRIMLHALVFTDKNVVEVKKQNNYNMAIKKKKEILKCIIIKYIIFFILNLVLLILFWYYLTSFNAVYQNTQIYLIENTCISFALSLFYPFIINIFPALLRMNSLTKKADKSCLYKCSQILQLI